MNLEIMSPVLCRDEPNRPASVENAVENLQTHSATLAQKILPYQGIQNLISF